MARQGGSGGLQTIFSFFLGLMVAAFVGVGVYTFHPPNEAIERELLELDRQEQAAGVGRATGELTEEERARAQELLDARNAAMDAHQEARDAWGRSTSMILIALATLVMVISLVRSDQLPVISNGLLLGGVFTMVYGVGWIVASDTSITRFMVLSVALVMTLGLGHFRFVRPRGSDESRAGRGLAPGEGSRKEASGIDGAGAEGSGDAGSADSGPGRLEERIRVLEERMDDAAAALGSRRD
jgi:hypothetical protein